MSKAWEASAPANIALIKYMGKNPGNAATNASLSLALKDFRTSVRLECSGDDSDRWDPLPGSTPLRRESTEKFLRFFAQLKNEFSIKENFLVMSGNNFPADAGIASSASSYAALTQAAMLAFSEIKKIKTPDINSQAALSRLGSGSSCRSFLGPWCVWDENKIYAPDSSAMPELMDIVVIANADSKKVSSSEAHQRVRSSPLFNGRVERANLRLQKSLLAMQKADLNSLAQIAWEELWDMHSLFHTSVPPFFYFAPTTLLILRAVEDWRDEIGHMPITTIDAGPNVHLLVPAKEYSLWNERLEKLAAKSKTPFSWMHSHAGI